MCVCDIITFEDTKSEKHRHVGVQGNSSLYGNLDQFAAPSICGTRKLLILLPSIFLKGGYKYDYSVYMGVTIIAYLLRSLLAHRPSEQ